MRAVEPLISLEVLGNPIVLAGTLSMFLLQAANVGMAVYLPVYLQSVLGLSASASGIGMLGLLLGTVAGATFSGRTIPRFFHYKRIAMVGVAFSVVCLGVLALVAGHASLAGGRAADDLHRNRRRNGIPGFHRFRAERGRQGASRRRDRRAHLPALAGRRARRRHARRHRARLRPAAWRRSDAKSADTPHRRHRSP